MNELVPRPDPESLALREEIALLREEVADLVMEENSLMHIVRPNLLALYQQKIGAWELQCLQTQVAAARARRKLELARAAVNRGQMPDWTGIEGQLELELLTWQQRSREAAEALEAANDRLGNLLSPGDDREVKKHYYRLVKALHPDVNPNQDEEGRRLWQRVQDAYERSDLEELRALVILAKKADGSANEANETGEALRRQGEILRAHILAMERRIDRITSEPPFTLRKNLEDAAWVAKRRAEIEGRSAGFDAQRAAMEAALEMLMKSLTDGQKPGLN